MQRLIAWSGLMMFLTASIFLFPSCTEEMPEAATGEALVYQLWDAFRSQDLESIQKNMAEGFQSVHDFGAYDMKEELELLRGLAIDEYTITDLKITTNDGDLIIATYFVSVAETINGERLSKNPSPRMTIFVRENGFWKWVAHANLKAVGGNEEPVGQ